MQNGFKKHAKLPRSWASQCKNQEPVRYSATVQTPLLKRYKTTTGEISRFSWLTIWSMSWKIDSAVVTKKQQHSAKLLFRQCYWHQKKHGWRPLVGFPRSMKIRFPHLWALMPRWLYGKESRNDKIPRPSRQLHQQFWRRSTIRCILTSQSSVLPYFKHDRQNKFSNQ